MLCRSARNVSAPTRPARSPRKAVRSGRRDTPSDSIALLSEADLYEASHLVCQMATQAFCRALQADADVVISQPGLRRGAGRCSNARWGRPCIWPRSSNAPLLRSRRPRPDPGIAPSVERAGAVVPTTKQYLLHHGFPSRSTAGRRLPVHAAGIVRRHGVPLQRLSHHASRRAKPQFPIEIADL